MESPLLEHASKDLIPGQREGGFRGAALVSPAEAQPSGSEPGSCYVTELLAFFDRWQSASSNSVRARWASSGLTMISTGMWGPKKCRSFLWFDALEMA
jgi:hypothetical protein